MPSRIPSLEEVIADAHQEWLAAQNYFENVSDPELVDHAIYLLEAAERKYVYLLRQARTSDVHSVTGTI
ncbi:MAG: YaaL family protein [Firmicutes bacterium]|nr:YaaL family protein [Bacillota bacterium]